MTTNTDTNTTEYVASVWTPHGEAIGEKYITAESVTCALSVATIWADTDYCEPYAMNCTVVIAEASTGKVVGWWLGEGNVIPSIITNRGQNEARAHIDAARRLMVMADIRERGGVSAASQYAAAADEYAAAAAIYDLKGWQVDAEKYGACARAARSHAWA